MAECWRIAQQLEVVDRLSGIAETERRQPGSPRLLIHILVHKMVHRPGNSRSSASGFFFSEQILKGLMYRLTMLTQGRLKCRERHVHSTGTFVEFFRICRYLMLLSLMNNLDPDLQ